MLALILSNTKVIISYLLNFVSNIIKFSFSPNFRKKSVSKKFLQKIREYRYIKNYIVFLDQPSHKVISSKLRTLMR